MFGRSRRKFLGEIFSALGALAVITVEPGFSLWAKAWAKVKKRILPRGTGRDSLINENPKDIDAHNLEITPLKDFGIMGLSDQKVNIEHWALKVEGLVTNPLRLSYNQVRGLPSIERKVLLICPGYFANQGLWKGVSIQTLLEKARVKTGVSHVTISGPEGEYSKPERFPIQDILSDKVFLAYQVNGSDLPQKNGFPLRLVAEDYYGSFWVKYADTITVEKV